MQINAKPKIDGRGGARPGAGRKPAGYQKPIEVADFEEARARNETAKAGINEIELSIKDGSYIARAEVCEASATLLATVAQTLRSIPDNLERKGVPAATCQMVERVLDDAVSGLADGLERLHGAAK